MTPPRWFETARGAWLLSLGALAVWFCVGQLAPGILIGVWLVMRSGGRISADDIEAQIVPFLGPILAVSAIVAFLVVLVLYLAGWLAPNPRGASKAWARWAWLLFSLVACIGGQFLLTLARRSAGWEPSGQDPVLSAAFQGGVWFFVFALAVTPLGEELLFRRVLLSTLSRGPGRLVAHVVTAGLFALVHVNLGYVPNYLWMSVWFAVAYEATGSVWGAVLVHALNNIFAFAAAMM